MLPRRRPSPGPYRTISRHWVWPAERCARSRRSPRELRSSAVSPMEAEDTCRKLQTGQRLIPCESPRFPNCVERSVLPDRGVSLLVLLSFILLFFAAFAVIVYS